MSSKIIDASTINKSVATPDFIDVLKISGLKQKTDLIHIDYSGDQDITLKLAFSDETADNANELCNIIVRAGSIPRTIPSKAHWIKAAHNGVAPTSGKLVVNILPSGL